MGDPCEIPGVIEVNPQSEPGGEAGSGRSEPLHGRILQGPTAFADKAPGSEAMRLQGIEPYDQDT